MAFLRGQISSLLYRLFPPPARLFGGELGHLRIRLLRKPGIETAGKTVRLPLPDTAVQILLRTSLGSPAQGELSAKLTEGSLFQWRIENVLIRLLRQHGILTTEQTIAFRIP
jgi:hypothetical protein